MAKMPDELTLLDYFAAHCPGRVLPPADLSYESIIEQLGLEGMEELPDPETLWMSLAARNAYEYAEAMVRQRKVIMELPESEQLVKQG